MPKIDIDKVPDDAVSFYPQQFNDVIFGRSRKRLGNAVGLSHFGVNICTIKPGSQSSQRHWHEAEDEFIYVLDGEIVVIEDGGEFVLKQGEAAGWKANSGNGHTVVNRSSSDALVLEIGNRAAKDRVVYPDIDLVLLRDGGTRTYTHKNGEPY